MTYLDSLHETIRSVVCGVWDPPADGNCGFHVLAKGLTEGDSDSSRSPLKTYMDVRNDLAEEAKSHEGHYSQMLGAEELLNCMERLKIPKAGPVSKEKWLVAPDMLMVAANAYGRPCILLSESQPLTCVPTRVSPNHGKWGKPLFLAFVGGNHFFQPQFNQALDKVIPYPPVVSLYVRKDKAAWVAWKDLLKENLALWNSGGSETVTKKARRSSRRNK